MPVQTKKIFIDSSVLLAFIDRTDPNHQKSTLSFDTIARQGFHIYTSYQNIADTYTTLGREVGISMALEFLQASLQSNIEIIFPQKADLITAHRMLRANRDRQISLRETLNATLMQKRGIMQILTFTYWHNLFGTYVSNLTA
ncbi:hypothetical protein A2867_02825 [Candidatus Daviesbacteria bacterium RIFCSPHIGHO2_01_FULL_40_11]|uniref:PIN domain-containing protein n=1 Tax=Candidatus Daviesbacteria bacterium RIFCSPHIGHO2_01_FULL_40_11 TaxID=1797762 RepID=A0A1F5JJM1_9BACT|nr:MAG: hypothetical protein A2867_02825 [Candidatus Daviesbacteria bacterium RIFCSPHIGHO2_01_FULL_40_11]